MSFKPNYRGACLVLNSTALKNKATEFISENRPSKVILMLDNDK